MVKTCPTPEKLGRLLMGDIPGDEGEELAQHLDTCLECTELASRLTIADPFVAEVREAANTPPLDSPSIHTALQRVRHDGSRDASALALLASHLAPPVHPDEIGRLGHYHILRHIGSGGMGLVMLAEDTKLQRKVALKFLHPELANNVEARQRFLGEARAVAAVRHEHVVTIHDIGGEAALPFLAMEFLEGESLEQLLRKEETVPVRHALRIGREIAEGLASAHERGLIHRDVKPANVWLERNNKDESSFRVKLLDFGLARPFDADGFTERGCVIGTPAFMSPEQAAGQPVDARSDLFSLGSTLYLLTTGQLPFRGAHSLATLSALANHHPPSARSLNPAVPQALSDLIDRLLAKDREIRPGSASIVAAELGRMETALAEADLRQRPPQRVWLWGLAAAAAILVIVAGGWIIRIRTKDGTEIEIPVPPGAKVELVERKDKPAPVVEPKVEIKPKDKPAPVVEPKVEIKPKDKPVPVLSPLDLLRREDIPAYELRTAGGGDPLKASADLVAVLGSSRFGAWGNTLKPGAYHPLGTRFAQPDSGAVRIIDPKTGEWLKSYRVGDVSNSSVVAYSADGKWLAFTRSVGGYYTRIVLVNEDTAQEQTIHAHDAQIQSLDFSPDSRSLLSASNDGRVRLWDVSTLQQKWTGTPYPLPTDKGPTVMFFNACFRPDGKVLAVHGNRNSLRNKDKKLPSLDPILILDAATGEKLHEIPVPGGALCWSADGKYLACVADFRFFIIDGTNWKTLHASTKPGSLALDFVRAAFHPKNSDLLVIAGKHDWSAGFFVWSVTKRDFLHKERTRDLNSCSSVVFRPDGTQVTFGGAGGITHVSTTDWKPLSSSAPRGCIADCAITADGRFVYAGGADGSLLRWDLTQLARPPVVIDSVPQPIRFVRLVDDDRALIFGHLWNHNFRIDLTKPQPKRVASYPNAYEIEVSRDGKTVVVIDQGQVRVFDEQGVQRRQFKVRSIGITAGYALSSDGARLVETPRMDKHGPIIVWDTHTGQKICEQAPRGEDGWHVDFSPDDKIVALRYQSIVQLRSADTLALVKTLGFTQNGYFQTAFRPDGKIVACVHGSGKVVLYETATGTKVRELALGTHAVLMNVRPRFSADGRYLLTANALGTIHIYRVAPVPVEVSR